LDLLQLSLQILDVVVQLVVLSLEGVALVLLMSVV
jgi:hypothetical protein